MILLKDENVDEDFDDGWWQGKEYYPCPPKKGIFVNLKSIKPYDGPRKKLQGDFTCLHNCTCSYVTLLHIRSKELLELHFVCIQATLATYKI